MAKLTISMAIFNSYVSHYQRVLWMVERMVDDRCIDVCHLGWTPRIVGESKVVDVTFWGLKLFFPDYLRLVQFSLVPQYIQYGGTYMICVAWDSGL